MLSEIIKKRFGRDNLRILRLLGGYQYFKFFIYKFSRKIYSFEYNEIKIYLRPWIKSDFSGVLGLVKNGENNYQNEIRNELKIKNNKSQIVFFDLGANIGLDSLSACLLFPNLSDLNIIEMDRDNMTIARINIEQFNDKKRKYINKAIWTDSETIVEYSVDHEPNAFSIGGVKKQGKYRQCQTISMGELILNEKLDNKIVILKMDIEGVEKKIFNQIDNFWLNSLDYFYVEYHEFNDNDKKDLVLTARENGLELMNEYDYWNFYGWGGLLFGKRSKRVKV
jgi:FkbM family methyltransferase